MFDHSVKKLSQSHSTLNAHTCHLLKLLRSSLSVSNFVASHISKTAHARRVFGKAEFLSPPNLGTPRPQSSFLEPFCNKKDCKKNIWKAAIGSNCQRQITCITDKHTRIKTHRLIPIKTLTFSPLDTNHTLRTYLDSRVPVAYPCNVKSWKLDHISQYCRL